MKRSLPRKLLIIRIGKVDDGVRGIVNDEKRNQSALSSSHHF